MPSKDLNVVMKVEKHSLLEGTHVKINFGGYGAGIADGKIGKVVKSVAENATWPSYAGQVKDEAVLFVKEGETIYGLAKNCEVELISEP